jgi:hypothetical protein
MEKTINRFLNGYIGEDLEIMNLPIFGSKPVEINYYFFLKYGRSLIFEIDKKGDDFELIREKMLCDIVESYLGFEKENSYPHIKKWIFDKYLKKIM